MRYTVGAAARATGITEARLRTWERRYGIPSPARSGTGRRLYDDSDIEVIRHMARLVDQGVPAAQAAESARAGTPAPPSEAAPAPAEAPEVARLVECAAAFDTAGTRLVVRGAVAAHGWARAAEDVLFPTLLRVGEHWEAGELSPAQEHFLSELVRTEIAAALAGIEAVPSGEGEASLVLLACAPGEHHDLGLLALCLLLAEAGVRTCYLGANVPVEALVSASRDTGAAAVCLSATVPTAVPELGQAARALLRTRPAPRVFVGGPAVLAEPSGTRLGGVPLPAPLPAAAEAVLSALGAGGTRGRAAGD